MLYTTQVEYRSVSIAEADGQFAPLLSIAAASLNEAEPRIHKLSRWPIVRLDTAKT